MFNVPLHKILRDPWYRALYQATGSETLVVTAGFFDDTLPEHTPATSYYALDVLTTPLHKITERLASAPLNETAYVLLSTGAFSPLHHGHLAMMEAAKKHLERQGKYVIGGYLSPSHDSYVSKKYGGTAALSAAHRIELCRQALSDHPWLMVDPWESYYTPCTINFTNVIERLENYLDKHLPHKQRLKIVYVCGSDNADFAQAFLYHGGDMVCVGRSGSSERFTELRSLFAPAADRIHFISETSASHCSSRAVRAGTYTDIPQAVRNQYQEWISGTVPSQRPKTYLIRNEGAWAVEPWSTLRPLKKLEKAYHLFVKNLGTSIEQSFNNATTPDRSQRITTRVLHLTEQHKLIAPITQPTISLDAATPGTHTLAVSRSFALSDGQHRALSLVARPGSVPLPQQRAGITPGTYTLLEDDIGSGFTVKKILGELPAGVSINAWTILSKLTTTPGEVQDIVDARDFLVGARDGGLVIKLPDGTLARAPYALPYVSLVSRAKIPPSQEMNLSKRIWNMNLDWYTKTCPTLTLKDADPAFQKLMKYIGFLPETLMSDICAWHVHTLTHLTTSLWETQPRTNKLLSISNLPTVMLMKNLVMSSAEPQPVSKTTFQNACIINRSSYQF